LSDSSKRPGTSRDISELKARLGLKKGGAPAPTAKNGGAVVPPPGVALPAPPGVSTQPAGPVVPSAADDPFGAMNAMAQIGTMQRAPEIVIVNDGKAVEHVGASKRTGTIVKYIVIALVPLAIGIVVGQIAKEAKIYNAGIADARLILNAKDNGVKDVKKKVVELQSALETSQKNGFMPNNDVTTALANSMVKLDVKQEAVFLAKQNSLNAALSAQILAFYAGVAEVRSMLQVHLESAKLDDSMLIDAAKEAADLKPAGYLAGFGDYRYGILFTAPTTTEPGARFGAKLVQLGKPFCADGAQSTTFECPDNKYTGVTYLGDQGWTKGDPQTTGAAADAKKIIPLNQTDAATILLKGNKDGNLPGVAEALYAKRLEALKARVDELIKTGNSVETKLKPKANEEDKFHFGFL
jgi:hypothetical protein